MRPDLPDETVERWEEAKTLMCRLRAAVAALPCGRGHYWRKLHDGLLEAELWMRHLYEEEFA